jgi:phosphohistidine swiveling domain-containing protein
MDGCAKIDEYEDGDCMIESDRNVLHQIPGPHVAWSRVNTAESIVGVQTPLSWSFWDQGGELGFRRAYCELGFLPRSALRIPTDVDEHFTAIFYGHAATNVSAFRAALDAMPFSATDDAEESFFSTRDDVERVSSPRRQRLAASWRLPLAALRLPRRLARIRVDSEVFWHESLAALPGEDVPAAVRRLETAIDRFSDEIAAQIVASTVATLFSGRLQNLIGRHPEAIGAGGAAGTTGERDDLELRLLGGFGDMEEIRVSSDLWRVAREGGDLELFLSRHGFRGPADGELSSHSWREISSPVESLLAPYRTLPEARSPIAAERRRMDDRAQAEQLLLARLSGSERWRARGLLSLASRYVPLRVIAKAAFQQTFDVARAAARQIGAAHARAKRIDDPEDIFFLMRDELCDPPAEARSLIASRRALRSRYQKLDLPLEFTGMPEPFALDDPETPVSTEPLSGLGVSAGVAEGLARVVFDPSEGELLPGEILVCNTTDPSWSSYFLIAAGVVIDVGGPLSHGAIVARELGIPCVINTVDGTRRLRTGDALRIDGSSGHVEVLS